MTNLATPNPLAKGLRLYTETVHPDEPCYGLLETTKTIVPKGKPPEPHRFQVVWVVRGDALVAHETDLGHISNFVGCEELRLLGPYGLDKVGEMRDEAERTRHDDYERKLRAEVRDSSTLIKDFLQEKEENWERIKNRSQFGPAVTKQRDDFPHELRERRI